MRRFKRNEAVQFLLHQLEKVPNREVCKKATEEQIKIIVEQEEIDFETIIDKFILDYDLDLKISEIPKELRFELVLYFVLCQKNVENYLLDDSDIWSEDNCKTFDWVSKVEKMFGNEEICNIELSELFEYAKSDKPDF